MEEYNEAEISEQELAVDPSPILSPPPSRKRTLQEEDQNDFDGVDYDDDTNLNNDDTIIEEMEPHKKAKKDVEVIEVINDTDEKRNNNINIINLTEDNIDDEKIEEEEVTTGNKSEEIPIENDIEVKEQTPLDINQEINLETTKNEIEVKKDHFQISESFKEWNQKEEVLLKPRISKFAEKVLIRAKETKEIEKKIKRKRKNGKTTNYRRKRKRKIW